MPNAKMKKIPALCCTVRIVSKYPRARNRTAASPNSTARNAFDRRIITTSPCRSRRVVITNGRDNATAPIKNAAAAHAQGTRNAGMMNIENPVAIPMGGMTIFFNVTARRDSCSRHTVTAARPKSDAITEEMGEEPSSQFYGRRRTGEIAARLATIRCEQ